jgi:hypothetical protein
MPYQKCLRCNKSFEAIRENQLYCSATCQKREKHKRFRNRYGDNVYMSTSICERCKKEYKTRRRKQKFCSRECASEARTKFLSIPDCLDLASKKLDKNIGYIRVYCPMHPNANTWGYVYEHRLIMEGLLGRHLKKEEHVHHKNGKRWDNRPENLEVLSASEHGKKKRERSSIGQSPRPITGLVPDKHKVAGSSPAAPTTLVLDENLGM